MNIILRNSSPRLLPWQHQPSAGLHLHLQLAQLFLEFALLVDGLSMFLLTGCGLALRSVQFDGDALVVRLAFRHVLFGALDGQSMLFPLVVGLGGWSSVGGAVAVGGGGRKEIAVLVVGGARGIVLVTSSVLAVGLGGLVVGGLVCSCVVARRSRGRTWRVGETGHQQLHL